MSLEQAGLSGGTKRPPSGSTYLERARLVRVRVRSRARARARVRVRVRAGSHLFGSSLPKRSTSILSSFDRPARPG